MTFVSRSARVINGALITTGLTGARASGRYGNSAPCGRHIRLARWLWGELDQHPHRFDLQAVFPHRSLGLVGLQELLKLRHVGYLGDETSHIEVVGVAEVAALDAKLAEHLVPASRPFVPGFSPNCTILNFVEYNCCCHRC